MPLVMFPNYETTQTTVTATTDPTGAWMTARQDYDGFVRRVYLTQASTATIAAGHPLFLVAATTSVCTSGDIMVVEPFLTASNVGPSCVGFAAQSASGNAMIWMQNGGHGTVLIRGTGATASYSHNQLVAFNSASGFVVTGAVGAHPTAIGAPQTVTLSTAATYTAVLTANSGGGASAMTVTQGAGTATIVATLPGVLPPIWARVAATGSVNGASAGTIGSASTDSKTIEAFILRPSWPYGGY